ncbi:MAG: recombinase family protein [Thermoleophilaceae bacterium]|nr:recombinase family protein [Thermoleophilaceae bacterium]
MLVGYARVSTADQSLTLQTDALSAAGCEKIYTDVASGAQHERTGLDEALHFAREGDTLVVWRLDRLARSLRQLIEVVNDLAARGVHFRSLSEEINTETAGGRLIFHVFGALAEFERELIRERTNAGLIAARARGRRGGRKPGLNEDQVKIALQLADNPAVSIPEICRTLGVSRATLYRHLAAAKG